MGTVYRFKAVLSGFFGGPGVNTWHICYVGEAGGQSETALSNTADDIMAVYSACASRIANDVSVQLSPIAEGFDIATGALTQVTGFTAPAAVAGTGTAAYSRASQANVNLKTDAIRGNTLLQGRHFIGPIGGAAFGGDGLLNSTTITQIQNAYGGIIDLTGAGRLVVWGQPNPDVEGLETGVHGYVQQVVCRPIPGTLRSRKR